MQLTHFGQSCLLVEQAGQRILIDPGCWSTGFEAYSDLDAIVITHRHADHLDEERLPALRAVNPGARLFADPDSAARLSELSLDAEVLVEAETVMLGPVSLTPRGTQHAHIHPGAQQITNVGVVLAADKEPVFFHPGDAYDAEPGAVDVLAVPLNAPWAALRDTLAFVQRIAPRVVVPIHDALLSEVGRNLYLTNVTNFGGGVEVSDIAGRGPVRVG